MSLRTVVSIAAVAAGLSLATAASAAITFTGPDGWSHSGQPSADGKQQFDQWKLAGDNTQTLTVIHDSTTAYADSVSAVKNNFASNHIRPGVDKDETCAGRPSHEFEYTVGPDEHQIKVNRIVIPDGPGVVTVTYAHSAKDDADPDVKKALDAFCKTAQP